MNAFVASWSKCKLGTFSSTKLSVFFNIVQTAFDPPPPPLFLNIYVADYIADYSAK